MWFVNLKKYLHYEFWPFGIFYIPAYFYYVILAVKSKNPFYFTVLNECMENAGAFLCSKSNYLRHFESLLKKNIRARNRMEDFKTKFKSYRDKIITKGEVVFLEPIGNHNRGTSFLDARHKKPKHLMECVEECANALPNFDYGRFDIKINNWDTFEQKKGIKIIEVNGVNSEPIHIYDPKYNIFKAYKDLFFHMKIIQQIAFHKMKNNASPLPSLSFIIKQ